MKIIVLPVIVLVSVFCLVAQSPKAHSPAEASGVVTLEKALALAEQGRCKEAIPVLKKVINAPGPVDARKTSGVAGLRCALALDNRDAALDFVRVLGKQFANDPEILFILVHAYSDLSTRTAQDLGRTAPQSVAAHKLNAEALETQGKWDDAEREYQRIIDKDPNLPGIHYLLGQTILFRPGADEKAAAERAKPEFEKELEIDPHNAGAHYVLGEIASKEEKWEEAIGHLSTAAKFDPSFAEAFYGWGFCLITLQRYAEAIAPLRAAEKLTPGNPDIHYTLATALGRSGNKEEAAKELAIHRELMASKQATPSNEKPQ